jgi:glycosyltransferase involved in cell wall biosynthesis
MYRGEKIMKTVAIYSYVPKLHSLYNEIIKYPPEGYTYSVDESKIDSHMKAFYTNPTLKRFSFQYMSKLVDTVRIKDHLYKSKKFPPHDLLYSTGYLCLRKEPWVVDMEFPSSFTGYSLPRFISRRDSMAKVLSAPHCKRIIPWTDAAGDVMRNAFPEKEIQEKIFTVPLSVSKKQKQKVDRKDGKVRIFFLGSSNLPHDFEIKGGHETLIAFERLLKKYDNIELIFRCYVPPQLKEHYSKLPGVKIIDYLISWNDLEDLYVTSDIFIGIAHYTPGVGHLEAMSYGLPVIGTDMWENPKIVTPDVGMLIPRHAKAVYYGKYGMPIWGFPPFMKAIHTMDEERVTSLMECIVKLVENENLRKKMGQNARYRVEEGPYSITARNKLLKEVYDDATR